MKCLSRSTLGIVIGSIYSCCSAVLIIYILAILCEGRSLPEEGKDEHTELLATSKTLLCIFLIISVVSLITSGVLILGIVKQLHTLMKPWICSDVIGIIYYSFHVIVSVVVDLASGLSFGSVLGALFFGLLTVGLQLLIFYPIYTLYVDIRDATNAQEQRGLNSYPQGPPIYGELEKDEEMVN